MDCLKRGDSSRFCQKKIGPRHILGHLLGKSDDLKGGIRLRQFPAETLILPCNHRDVEIRGRVQCGEQFFRPGISPNPPPITSTSLGEEDAWN